MSLSSRFSRRSALAIGVLITAACGTRSELAGLDVGASVGGSNGSAGSSGSSSGTAGVSGEAESARNRSPERLVLLVKQAPRVQPVLLAPRALQALPVLLGPLARRARPSSPIRGVWCGRLGRKRGCCGWVSV